jgi:23S rRNA pseudouridine2457 synthase
MNNDLTYHIIYKPFGMLSQFSAEGDKRTLAALSDFPKDVYPVGRLDSDSEGLLILTTDKELNHRLLNPKFKHRRTYLAQVEGKVTSEAITDLTNGVAITIDGKIYQTLPAQAMLLPVEPIVPERNPPIRFRKNIPTSWLELTLHEGKNRQVRKMTAAVGFPTLRLIRKSIEGIELGDMQPGDVKELPKEMISRLLFRK